MTVAAPFYGGDPYEAIRRTMADSVKLNTGAIARAASAVAGSEAAADILRTVSLNTAVFSKKLISAEITAMVQQFLGTIDTTAILRQFELARIGLASAATGPTVPRAPQPSFDATEGLATLVAELGVPVNPRRPCRRSTQRRSSNRSSPTSTSRPTAPANGVRRIEKVSKSSRS